ncbi:MAG: hydroxymethylbilane synthase, partial [Dehalococcoidia bacterium]|nr:hydroxymethylbilane synthase [Dehalococcoidia bacterium]
RLGRESEISSYLSPEECVPDVGQGALAVQVRDSDSELLDIVNTIDHVPTSAAVRAERAFLTAMGGGCTMPTAAYAGIEDDRLRILAMVATPDGSSIYRVSESYDAESPEVAGTAVSVLLLEMGASRIMEAL